MALARALAIEPAVVLLDEPFSRLDAKLREGMRFELRALQREVGFTAIMVTHDQGEALSISDRIAIMDAGKLQQVGTPQDIYHHPETRFVAAFDGARECRSRRDRASGTNPYRRRHDFRRAFRRPLLKSPSLARRANSFCARPMAAVFVSVIADGQAPARQWRRGTSHPYHLAAGRGHHVRRTSMKYL